MPYLNKMISLLLVVSVQSASNYGEYHFYKNMGGVFYDYSGNGYHALNGEEVLADSHDTTPTDRGAYFDGVSSYITIHSDVWKHVVLPDDWSTTSWVYPMERRAFLSRFREDLSPAFMQCRLQYIAGDEITIDLYECNNGSCAMDTLTTATGLLTLNNWYILAIRLFDGQTAIDWFKDLGGRVYHNFGDYYEDPAGTYKTYLGTDFNTFYKGFYYMTRFKNGITDRADLFTSSGCTSGKCYFYDSVLDHTYCSCSYCTKDPSKYCISSCIDLATSADCLACSSCNGICSAGNSCLECDEANWPSCDMDGTSISSTICNPDCQSCKGPSETECIYCALTYASVDSSTSLCTCPTNSTPGSTECECSSGYVMIFDGTNYNCEVCVSPCAECSGTVHYCTDCDFSKFSLNSGVCSCPSNAEKVGNTCQCQQYFYDTCTGSCADTITCSPCDSSCSTCNGAANTNCLTCTIANANVDSGTSLCTCPSSSVNNSGTCECSNSGEGMNYDGSTYSCQPCHSDCAACSGTADTDCLTCSMANANIDATTNVCTCPSSSVNNSGTCECSNSSEVMTYDGSIYSCQLCHSDCTTCSGITDTECLTCSMVNANIDTMTNLCACPSSSNNTSGTCECSISSEVMTYDGSIYSCQPCHSDCATCSGITDTECLTCSVTNANIDSTTNLCTCPELSSVQDGSCVCESGYLMVNNGSVNRCEACASPCSECSGSQSYCTKCDFSNSILDDGVCSCPVNSNKINTECVCEDGYYSQCLGCSCVLCNHPCQTCQSSSMCLSCLVGTLTPSQQCLTCDSGFYVSDSFDCEACGQDCMNCIGENQCYQCKHLFQAPNSKGECECVESTYYTVDEGCKECRSTCKTCTSYSDCDSCKANASGATCECDAYFTETSEGCEDFRLTARLNITTDNTVYVDFESNLQRDLVKSDLDIKIANNPNFDWNLYSLSKAQIRIDLTFNEFIEEGSVLTIYFQEGLLSEDLGYLVTTELAGSLHEFLYEIQIMETVESVTKVSTGGGLTMSAFTGFSGLWVFVNTIQILMLIPLTTNPLTQRLYYFFQAFSDYFPIPNTIEYFLEDHGSKPYTLAYKFGIKTNDFLINTGEFSQVLAIIFLCSCSIGFMNKMGFSKYSWFSKILKAFRYGIFIRFFIEVYLEIGLYAILQLLDVIYIQIDDSTMQGTFNSFLAILCLMFLVLFPSIVVIGGIYNKEKVLDFNESEFHERWGSLYYEFKFNGKYTKTQYYSVFLFRRFLFLLNLVLLRAYPITQAVINLVLALIVRLIQHWSYVVFFRPFMYWKIQLMNVVSETAITSVFFLVIGFHFELVTHKMLDLIIISVILTEMAFIFFMNMWMTTASIVGICRKHRRKRKTAVLNEETTVQDHFKKTKQLRNEYCQQDEKIIL